MGESLPFAILAASALLSLPLARLLHWALDDTDVAGSRARLDRLLAWLVGGVALRPQSWRAYLGALLLLSALMLGAAWAMLQFQQGLPLNPDGKPGMPADLAFHTAASFLTNTNQQHYSGEQSLSYHSQLHVVAWLQFASAAMGLAVLAAVGRCLSGRTESGNLYRDVARAMALVLLPLSLLLGVAYVALGVPMTLDGAAHATTLEGLTQTIARGPVAAVLAVKQLGTNGGGYFGTNAAHPFENPGLASDVLSHLAILVLPMACVWWFGRLVGRPRESRVIFLVMAVLIVALTTWGLRTESAPPAALAGLSVQDAPGLEGKELRLGVAASAGWAVATTATSNGSVNAMHDSLQPLTVLAALSGMWLNVAFGGVGVGMLNMLLFVVTAVFVAGTMVGRTPEYLGRKVEAREMKIAVLALLVHPLLVLGGSALFAATSLGGGGPHDAHSLTRIVYEFSSASANNGSGMEGLADGTPAWNVATGLVVLLGRYLPIAAPLAIAASLAGKRAVAESAGTFRTDGVLFAVVLLGVVFVTSALLFLPVAVLGPVAEHMSPLLPG